MNNFINEKVLTFYKRCSQNKWNILWKCKTENILFTSKQINVKYEKLQM